MSASCMILSKELIGSLLDKWKGGLRRLQNQAWHFGWGDEFFDRECSVVCGVFPWKGDDEMQGMGIVEMAAL